MGAIVHNGAEFGEYALVGAGSLVAEKALAVKIKTVLGGKSYGKNECFERCHAEPIR